MKCGCMERDKGPDCGFSWIILACGVFIFLTVGGLVNSNGVLFVQILQVYGTNREGASWTFSINIITRTLVGLIAGMLLHTVDIYKITLFGTIVSSFGFVFCFFAKQYLLLIVFFGVLRGIGDGVLFVVANHAVVMYFSKWRTTVVGVLLVSMSVGTSIYVALMEYLLLKYGLRGMFLILGAINMNMIPAGLLIKTPVWMTPRWKNKRHATSYSHKNDSIKSVQKGSKSCIRVQDEDTLQENLLEVKSSVSEGSLPQTNNLPNGQSLMDIEKNGGTSTDDSIQQMSCYEKIKSTFVQFCHIFKNPLFLLLVVITVPYIYYYMTYVKIIVDVGTDQGLSPTEAAYLMAFFSAGNIFGRPCFGLMIDQFGLQPKIVCAVCLLVLSVCCFALPFGYSFYIQAALAVVFGLLDGAIMPILTSAVPEYVGIGLNPMALATLYFIAGMLGLTRPAFTGYFRDTIGSYDGIFYTFGACFIVCSLAWVMEPTLMKMAKKDWKCPPD